MIRIVERASDRKAKSTFKPPVGMPVQKQVDRLRRNCVLFGQCGSICAFASPV